MHEVKKKSCLKNTASSTIAWLQQFVANFHMTKEEILKYGSIVCNSPVSAPYK